jgi:hypothetical protein
MNGFDMIVVSFYDHFYKMHQRGRNVSPWLQTAFIISLDGVILTSFLAYSIFTISSNKKWHISEYIFLPIFLLVGLIYFFVIKKKYFDSEKHIKLYEVYLSFPHKTQVLMKTLIIGGAILVPFLFEFLIWLTAK